MATFTVTTASDLVSASDGVLSLREAVQQANATVAADTIVFANALEGQVLTLTQGQLTLAANPAIVGNELTIDGDADNNGSRVTLSGGNASRVLEVQAQADVTIDGLVVANGHLDEGNGAGILIGQGCGVAISNSRVHSSVAGGGTVEVGYGAGQGGDDDGCIGPSDSPAQ